ncbi:expansin EXLX1 family cellulose-binding protein [Streptomyces flavalbus]|uniref:Expansin EXLX1 family cellulose-binding protein n=1 Tax=Streptomyces flavalbus TaxID=2665155 RepID=A0ABW2WIQ2_9ACTN
MAAPSHRRPRDRKRRTALLPAAAVATVALVIAVALAARPDHRPDEDVRAAATPAATVHPTPTHRKPTATPTRPKAKATKASPTAPPNPPRPSTTATDRPAPATAPLAGRIRPHVTYQGTATFYDAGDGDGACTYGPTDDVMTAAMNTTDYETAKACGAYVRVRAASGAAITVRITNECPAPCAPGQLDLTAQAFAKLAAPSAGQIPITWTLLSPATSDTVSVRYKTGSSAHWCGLQVIGHRNPVARLELRTGSGWRALPRAEYNYFLSEQGTGCGGALRITDIYGERLTADAIALRPDTVQPTGQQFRAHTG